MGTLAQAANAVRQFFVGKKQILGGAVIIVAGVAGVFMGKLTPDIGLLVAGAGLSVCGHAAKSDREHTQLLAALGSVATAGVDLRLGNHAGAVQAIEGVALTAATQIAPLAIHVSGESADVLAAVTALTAQPAASTLPIKVGQTGAPAGVTGGPKLPVEVAAK